MHIYFSGIGGAGIGPLAIIAKQAGFDVSGSDKQHSSSIQYLNEHGITNVHIGQTYDHIANVHAKQPIDWLVYTSALPMEQPDAPELRFCQDKGIKSSKRDEFLSFFLSKKGLKLLAVAGTHGKTTTTALMVWLFKQLDLPVSYSIGGKLSFGDMGEYNPESDYFIYEADEFDRNFLSFSPYYSLITGIDWDHPDIYPTRASYNEAFRQFLAQSQSAILWQEDAAILEAKTDHTWRTIDEHDERIDTMLKLPGRVNRFNAWLVAQAVHDITQLPLHQLIDHLNRFPGVSRRFEQLAPQFFTDYAHTPPKIRGALQLASEVAGDKVVVVYEGLHNTRQHFIKDELRTLFDNVKHLYIVPSYLAREDERLALLSPKDLTALLSSASQAKATPSTLDQRLLHKLRTHAQNGDLILALSAGGGGSLDEWLRNQLQQPTTIAQQQKTQ